MNASVPETRPPGQRYFYVVAAVLVLLVVFTGFAPSFYLKGHLGPARELSLLVRIHGVVMTAWYALLLVQAVLIRWPRPDLHRQLGFFGGFLAAAVAVLASVVQLNATRDERARLGWLHVEGAAIGSLLVFFILVGLALYWRKRPEIHKRLMLVATLSLLGAAWGRFPVEFIRHHSDLLTKGSMVSLVAVDTWIHRRLHPAYCGGILFVFAAGYALDFL
jgi:Na+-translocating ferredoxin:NAD+ oxidoreductase RnfA subunit